MVKPKAIICDENITDRVKESLDTANLKETTIYIFGAPSTRAKSVNELIVGFDSNPSTFKYINLTSIINPCIKCNFSIIDSHNLGI